MVSFRIFPLSESDSPALKIRPIETPFVMFAGVMFCWVYVYSGIGTCMYMCICANIRSCLFMHICQGTSFAGWCNIYLSMLQQNLNAGHMHSIVWKITMNHGYVVCSLTPSTWLLPTSQNAGLPERATNKMDSESSTLGIHTVVWVRYDINHNLEFIRYYINHII